MKLHKLAAAIATSSLLAACSTFSPGAGPTYRVGPDYTATGSVNGVKAYVYGERTLIQYERTPFLLSIKDVNGQSVGYELEGQFYRLDRKLTDFTARADLLKATSFHLLQPQQPKKPDVATVVSKPAPIPAPIVAVYNEPETKPPVKLTNQEDAELLALLAAAQRQLTEVRASVEHGATDLASLERLHARLDQIQGRLNKASSSMLMVYFERYKTNFQPSPEVAELLVSVAKTADLVKVRGRTDSVVPGSMDGKIAKARALSARSYLVDRGVDPAKIEVSALAAGDFIAPNTPEGKTLNRRVEIEFVSQRLGTLQKPKQPGLASVELSQ
jgi:outer membrane protein OmpA-like peptidoglycan-associated protein